VKSVKSIDVTTGYEAWRTDDHGTITCLWLPDMNRDHRRRSLSKHARLAGASSAAVGLGLRNKSTPLWDNDVRSTIRTADTN